MSLTLQSDRQQDIDPEIFQDYVEDRLTTKDRKPYNVTSLPGKEPPKSAKLLYYLRTLERVTRDHDLDQGFETLVSTPLLLETLSKIENLTAQLPDDDVKIDTPLLLRLRGTCSGIANLIKGIHRVAAVKDTNDKTSNPQFDLAHRFLDHDLNAFLLKPAGYADAMLEDGSDEYVGKIEAMLPFMRELSQAIAHTMLAVVSRQPKMEQYNLVEALEPLVQAIQFQHKGKYPNLTVDLNIDETCMLVGDKHIVSYAVFIALDNAIKAFYNKYGRDKQPTLSVVANTKQGVLSLKVTDNGPGVNRPLIVKKISGHITHREQNGESLTPFEIDFKSDPEGVLKEVGYDAIMEYLNARGITMTEGGTGIGLEIATTAMSSLGAMVRVYDNAVDQNTVAGATTEFDLPVIITPSRTPGIRAVVHHVVDHVMADISPRALPTIIKSEFLREKRYNPALNTTAHNTDDEEADDYGDNMPSVSGIME